MTTRRERARDILRPVCRCHEPSGTLCQVHDLESMHGKPGERYRLLRDHPWDGFGDPKTRDYVPGTYAHLFNIGYGRRPMVEGLRDVPGALAAWQTGVQWRARDDAAPYGWLYEADVHGAVVHVNTPPPPPVLRRSGRRRRRRSWLRRLIG